MSSGVNSSEFRVKSGAFRVKNSEFGVKSGAFRMEGGASTVRGGALKGWIALLLFALALPVAHAQEADESKARTGADEPAAVADQPAKMREDAARAARLTAKGAQYLLATQDRDGAWVAEAGPGISALVLKALVQEPTVGPAHPAVRRGFEWLLRFQHDDGGFYSPEGLIKNYETSVALSALSVWARHAETDRPSTRDESPARSDRYADAIDKARKFLIDLQWDEGEDRSVDDPWYGGAGYGGGKRPDLSNTQMMLEALHDSGLPEDHPAYQKALVFISRTQMLGESNDQPFARGSTQGGFIYSPANNGESKAGTVRVDGREELRCYGSMTYAGFKSMLYAGLTADDPRVKAALDWIGRHWTLDYNPNMPERQSKEGLFYYYHVFARALDAFGKPVVEDQSGRAHRWREELVAKLAELQRPDGSWINDEDRWMEGAPALTTAYSMLALQAAFDPA